MKQCDACVEKQERDEYGICDECYDREKSYKADEPYFICNLGV